MEVIVQDAPSRSLGTKSLDIHSDFSLRESVAFTNTDLRPLDNNLQRIRFQFFGGIIMYKTFRTN